MTEDLMVNFWLADPEKFAFEIDFDPILLKLGILTQPEEFIPCSKFWLRPDEDMEIAPFC